MTLQSLYNFFAIFTAYSVVLPIWSGIKRRRALTGNNIFVLLLVYLILCLMSEFINLFFIVKKIYSVWPANLFYFAEFLIFTQIFYFAFFENRKLQKFITISRLLCGALYIVGIYNDWLGIFKGASGCVIMILSVLLFYHILIEHENNTEIKLSYNSLFILNCAILIYFSATFFVFLFETLVDQGGTFAMLLWTVPLFFNLVFYLMLNHAICKMKNT